MRTPYRVIQWATGTTGQAAIRTITERTDLEIVGARVYDSAKVGADVGETAGIGPIGVSGASDESDMLALDTDCVLWFGQVPMTPDGGVDELCRILSSGKNVVSIVHALLAAPDSLPPEMRDPIESACAEGASSLHFTGIDPGFANEVLALTLTSLCGHVDRVTVRELLDYREYSNATIVFDLMGFGKPPEEPTIFIDAMAPFFGASLNLVAQGLGIALDDIRPAHETRVTDRDVEIAAGKISSGTVGAMRFSYTGYVEGEPRVSIEHITRLAPDMAPDWPAGKGYEILIEGDPPVKASFELGIGEDRSELSDAVQAAAMRAVNSIPLVCAAPPGLRTVLELPMVTARNSSPT